MDITFINVGYGEAILITCEDPACESGQFVMLIDGGSAMDSEYTGESGRIRAWDLLQEKQISHIDLLVFSHVHEDHTCGLVPIIESLPVRQFWTSVGLDPAHYGKHIEASGLSDTNRKALDSINAYSMLMEKLKGRAVTWLDDIHPDHFRQGDLSIDILGPDPAYKRTVEASLNRCFTAGTPGALDEAITETTESMNNASLILRLHYKGHTVLLCGDTNAGGFAHVMRMDPALLKADVFKIGHHGQADSVSDELVRAVDPSFIVCCASNDYRHTSSNEKTFETISRSLAGKQMTYLFQDGLYNAEWNGNTDPRHGVMVCVGEEGIGWKLVQNKK